MMPTSQCMHSALSMPLTAAVHCVVCYRYPPFYNDLVGLLGVFSLDFLDVMPIGCVVKLNHDHLLLLRTLAPLLLLLISWLWRRCLKTTQAFADQLLTMNFVVLYLLFPSNSASIQGSQTVPTAHCALSTQCR